MEKELVTGEGYLKQPLNLIDRSQSGLALKKRD